MEDFNYETPGFAIKLRRAQRENREKKMAKVLSATTASAQRRRHGETVFFTCELLYILNPNSGKTEHNGTQWNTF